MSEFQPDQPKAEKQKDLEDLPAEEVSEEENADVKGGLGLGKALGGMIKTVAPTVL